jgi:hypothetical protein
MRLTANVLHLFPLVLGFVLGWWARGRRRVRPHSSGVE